MGGDIEAHVGFGVRLADGMLSAALLEAINEGKFPSLRLLPIGYAQEALVLALASSVRQVTDEETEEHCAFDTPERTRVLEGFGVACSRAGITTDLGEPSWHLTLNRW
jgi:hypothetical protein